MSIPDHGEFDNPTPRDHSFISMAKTFLDFYVETDNKADFDAAMTMLERAYRIRYSLTRAIGAEIDAAVVPITPHEPHFADTATPGQVVPISVLAKLINPLPRPDELDE